MIQNSMNQFLVNAAGLQRNIQSEREEVQKKDAQAKAEGDKSIPKKDLGEAIDRVIQQASYEDYLGGQPIMSPADIDKSKMAMQRVAAQARAKQQQAQSSFVFNQETFNKMRGGK